MTVVSTTRLGQGWTLVDVDLPPGTIPLAHDPRASGEPSVAMVVAPAPEAPRRWGLLVATPAGQRGFSVVVRTTGAPVVVRVEDAGHATAASDGAEVDYRGRDFDALRQVMLRRIEDAAPAGADIGPVPQTTAVVEVLAFLADGLSYAQDAIATEAYLATARMRVSATRHAALLDYRVGEGSNARTWVRVDLDGPAPVLLPRGTQLLTRVPGLPLRLFDAGDVDRAVGAGALVFETTADALLHPGELVCPLDAAHHWGRALPAGATRATLETETRPAAPGELVVIETSVPPFRSHVVRLTGVQPSGRVTEIEWDPADAVPASLATGDPMQVRVCNLLLADEGRTLDWERLPAPRAGELYRPALARPETVFASRGDDGSSPAARALEHRGPPRAAVTLEGRSSGAIRPWRVRPSLLDSERDARDFVVEVDDDGYARLRFGDGVSGARPRPGADLHVRQRVGRGAAGNVPAGAIAHILSPVPGLELTHVENVVPARGGTEREKLSSVRVFAPRTDLVEERVVTRAEFRAAALAVDGVLDADVDVVSTGSSERVLVYVDGGRTPASAVLGAVEAAIAPRVLVGVTFEVRPAVTLPVEIALEVWMAPHGRRETVVAALDDTLRAALFPAGERSFRRELRRSEIVAAAARAEGVADARVTSLRIAGSARERESVRPRRGEIVRLAAPRRDGRAAIRYRFAGGAA